MIASPFSLQPHPLGHVYEDSSITVFFGDARGSAEDVASAFPDYELSILRQTHSDLVVHAKEKFIVAPEADAQFSRARKLALCVRTADCLPVLIYAPDSGAIAAIHAGWRGIENEIIRKTGSRLVSEGVAVDLQRARAWIGPHIAAASFEVDWDVARKLEARFDAVRGHSNQSTSLVAHESPETKARVDLLAIAQAQLASIGIHQERIVVLPIDTMKSAAHASFRRDKDRAGRQIAFIARK